MEKNKKVLSVLSTAAVAGLIVAAVSTPASAQATAIDIKDKDAKLFEYQYQDLKDSATVAALDSTATGATLYNDFLARKASLAGYYDSVTKGHVSMDTLSQALIAGTVTDAASFKTFMEDAKTPTTAMTPGQVTVGTDGYIAIDGVSTKPVDPTPTQLTVSSVSAINANEIKVTFNKAVNKDSAEVVANYGFTSTGKTIVNAKLQDDNMSVILTTSAAFANGNTYKVDITGVMDTNYNKVTEYKNDYVAFVDNNAPTLLDASITSAGKVKLTFNKPVSTTMTVKVDGTQVATSVTATSTPYNSGDYSYYTNVIPADQSAVGTHTIVVYSATDTVASTPNVAPVLTKTVTVAQDTTAPSVVSVTAKNQNTFKVKFSEVLNPNLVAGNLTVKKGSLVFPAGSLTIAPDADDATGCTYTVQVADVNQDNKLYATGETSVSLSVNVKGYSDKVALVGAEYNGTVTLSKDTTGPVVASSNLNTTLSGQYLLVKFDEAISSPVASKISVSKDGILKTVGSAIVDIADTTGKTLKIDLGSGQVGYGSYTVTLGEGAVTDAYSNKNLATTTTVNNTASTSVVPLILTAGGNVTAPTSGNNTIAINYGVDMDNSAIDIANYKLDGAAFPAGTTIGFVADKQHVQIILPANCFKVDTSAVMTVTKNVKKADSTPVVTNTNLDENQVALTGFTDNTQPQLVGAKFVVGDATQTTTNALELTFDEAMTFGDDASHIDDFAVKVNGAAVTIDHLTAGTTTKQIKVQLHNAVVITQNVTVEVVKEGTDNTTMNTTDSTSATTKNKLKETTTPLTVTDKTIDTLYGNAQAIATDKAALAVSYNGTDATVTLPATGSNGTAITWVKKTDAASVANLSGNTLTIARSNVDDTNDTVTLTATIAKNGVSDTKDITITVKEAKAPGTPALGTNHSATALDIVSAGETDWATVAVTGGTATSAAAGTVSGGNAVSFSGMTATTGQTILFTITDVNGNTKACTATFDGTTWTIS